MSGTYIYAIIPNSGQETLDVAGLDNEQDEVYTIPLDGLSAVVSASPLNDYRGLERDKAARYLVTHQRVVETTMKRFPTLPLKFGTVLPDDGDVQSMLAQGRELFHTKLDEVADKVQVEIVVLWDLQAVFGEIAQEDEIVEIKAQAQGASPAEFRQLQMAIGKAVQAGLAQRRQALQAQILPTLETSSLDVVINPLMDDNMVLNVALLMEQNAVEGLDQALERLDAEMTGDLLFRRVGPLPPYSFATVEVRKPSYEQIQAARRLLGLEEQVEPREIKDAYRRRASQVHPDHNADAPDAKERMAELTQAYRLLTDLAESQAHEGAPCRFDQEAASEALLIDVQRQALTG